MEDILKPIVRKELNDFSTFWKVYIMPNMYGNGLISPATFENLFQYLIEMTKRCPYFEFYIPPVVLIRSSAESFVVPIKILMKESINEHTINISVVNEPTMINIYLEKTNELVDAMTKHGL